MDRMDRMSTMDMDRGMDRYLFRIDNRKSTIHLEVNGI